MMLAGTSPEQWRRAIEVAVMGLFTAVLTVTSRMREAGEGSIIHLGSAADTLWPPREGLSVAPKAANEALVRGVAKEEDRFGICANSVLGAVIEAAMFLELLRSGAFDEHWTSRFARGVALKRWG